MRPYLVVIARVRLQNLAQMHLAQDNDVVYTLTPDRSDQPFGKAVLPGRGWRGRLADEADEGKEPMFNFATVVSFGLFGDQGVFKSEATGAAQVVANRFGNGTINVQYNSKRGGGATIEALAMSLQVAAKGMDADSDILFLILTSHGSRAGLAVKAGRLTQTLTPSTYTSCD